MNNPNTHSFYFRLLPVAGGFLFLVLLCIPFVNLIFTSHQLADVISVAIISTPFLLSLLPGGKFLVDVINGTPALQITPEGIHEYKSKIFLRWEDIVELSYVFRRGYKSNTKNLSVKVRNEEDYFSQIDNPIIRFFLKRRGHKYHTTFLVNLSRLNEKPEKIMSVVKEMAHIHNKSIRLS